MLGAVGIGNTLKIKIINAIDEIFQFSPKSAAVMKGIITGDTGDFSNSLYDGFKDAGFMHIAAVSGTHVSILFGIVSLMLSALNFKRSMTTGIAIIILFVFCSVAGFTSSAVRATIMLTVSLLAVFLDREYDMKTALFFSGFVILMIYPYKLFSPGFLLSFGATLGIALFYRPVLDYFEKLEKRIYVPSFITSSLSLSSAAFLGTMPFCMNFFDSINFISLITNMWIIPVVTASFTIGLSASIIFYICPWISVNILKYLCEPFLFVIIKTAELFCGKNFGIINFDFVPVSFYIIYIGLIIIFYKILKARD